jgi:ankyrin repeat protein
MVGNEGLSPTLIGTCLCLAALYGFDDCVDTLLKHGAPLNFKSVTGHTPLMKAVMSGNASTVELLLRSGADTSIRTDSGLNVVDIAIASNADEEIINMLNADSRGNLGS